MTNTHILVHAFDYLEPTTLQEAVALLEEHGEQARVLAGGTDLLVHMKMERLAPRCLISLRRVPGLSGIDVRDDHTWIGARTPIRTIRNHPWIQVQYPALAEACASFSTTQVQVQGTIGGNLGNGSPASDSAPALIAFDAEVVIEGPGGERRMPVEEFFLGPGRTALGRGELITGVVLPRPPASSGSAFLKVSRVAADLAKVNAAVRVVREGDRIAGARLAFGAVAPTPVRARRAEAALVGRPLTEEVVAEVAGIASEEVSPIDDVRSDAWYRREIVRVMVHDGLYEAWRRAGEAGNRKQEARVGGQESGGREQEAGEGKRVAADERCEITLKVNGEVHRLWVAPNELLLNVLRERLHLTGSKYGCGIGECGACTVRIDGKLALSCLVLAVAVDGSEVLTVEGLAGPDGELDPLQEAFIEHAAFQCGFCTPGMLITAKSLLEENPTPTEAEVRDYLKGNLCRCTGYAAIVRAIMGKQ